MTTALSHFLAGRIEDNLGRRVTDYHNKDHDWFESEHDFIQWMFPTDRPSKFNPFSPLVNENDIESFHADMDAQYHLMVSFTLYKDFLFNTHHWRHDGNHNNLRITRVIECLRLFWPEQPALALSFYMDVMRLTKDSDIGEVTRGYWLEALDYEGQKNGS